MNHPHCSLNSVLCSCLQVAANGSVADLDIPEDLKALYKTVWEIKQRVLVDMVGASGGVQRGGHLGRRREQLQRVLQPWFHASPFTQ